MFQANVAGEINTHLMFNNFFPKFFAVYEIMWENIVKPDSPQMTM